MAEQVIEQPAAPIAPAAPVASKERHPFEGETIVAENISYEDFLRLYDGKHAEWFDDKVIIVMSTSLKHQRILFALGLLLKLYFQARPIGKLVIAPYSMRVNDDLPNREPDIVVVLHENVNRLKDTYLDGPADIAIEIVSLESVARDHSAKFQEYAKAGVKEYWLFDPLKEVADFYALDQDNHYHRIALDEKGRLISTLLPDFALDPEILWRDEEPQPAELFALMAHLEKS